MDDERAKDILTYLRDERKLLVTQELQRINSMKADVVKSELRVNRLQCAIAALDKCIALIKG